MFNQYTLDYSELPNPFVLLSDSIEFENITKGRIGTNIFQIQNDLIPLVRTTTKYNKPGQKFLPVHSELVNKIRCISGIEEIDFNNGLVEIYSSQYRTMGFHTDQAQDLESDSYICICSFYSDSNTYVPRTLVIKNKSTGIENQIKLTHNSIVLFSTQTNSEHIHKIILDSDLFPDTTWLGITLRLSKTFVKFSNSIPYFYPTKRILRLVESKEEEKEFYKLRSLENSTINFTYPELDWTLSPSDLIEII